MLVMCFCPFDFHLEAVLTGFCELFDRGVAKSLSFFTGKLQDCDQRHVSSCPRFFLLACDGWEEKTMATVCLDLVSS